MDSKSPSGKVVSLLFCMYLEGDIEIQRSSFITEHRGQLWLKIVRACDRKKGQGVRVREALLTRAFVVWLFGSPAIAASPLMKHQPVALCICAALNILHIQEEFRTPHYKHRVSVL